MPDPPSTLQERFDAVCRLRGLNDHQWSLGAGLSEKYLYVARNRALKSTRYRLPEDGAQQLADFARVNVEWLRYGRGPMEGTAAPVNTQTARESFVQQLTRSIAELHAAGDVDAARRATALLGDLLLDQAPPSTSVAIPPGATGTARR